MEVEVGFGFDSCLDIWIFDKDVVVQKSSGKGKSCGPLERLINKMAMRFVHDVMVAYHLPPSLLLGYDSLLLGDTVRK